MYLQRESKAQRTVFPHMVSVILWVLTASRQLSFAATSGRSYRTLCCTLVSNVRNSQVRAYLQPVVQSQLIKLHLVTPVARHSICNNTHDGQEVYVQVSCSFSDPLLHLRCCLRSKVLHLRS
uniref:Uncharacterized protein n=1 Tax=Ixodes ricinus TaxID=34613 RepID=A0A0K8RJ15_IXORI